MSKIAILDTGISPEHLKCRKFQTYRVCGEDGKSPSGISHGTVCARVLDYFAADYELFSIRIMNDSREIKRKPMGDILHLEKGLRLCLELNVDVVCMSAVSSILSDSGILYKTAKELSKKSILLAALDNKRYVTIPTAYPFVLGVQSDVKKCLEPGALAYQKDDLLYAGLYANCNIGLLKELDLSPSNSFAVPVAAAKINDWMNHGESVPLKIRNLRQYPAHGAEEEIFMKQKSGRCRELPLIVLHASGNENLYVACQTAMDGLYSRYGVQSSALCSMEMGSDVRFRKLKSLEKIKDEILFMECCYKTDLIFLIAEGADYAKVIMQANADLEIELRGENINILSEDGCFKGAWEEMADMVYDILQ